MFNQIKFALAQLRQNYQLMADENEKLRKENEQLKKEIESLKK